MDKKPKAGGATRKAKQQNLEDKEQSERFIKTARELGVDESEKSFEELAEKLLPPRRKYDHTS